MENNIINFAKTKTSLPVPDLIEVQKKSYDEFFQMDLLPSERKEVGLEALFKQIFPITDYRGLYILDFVEYSIGNYECKCGKLKGIENLRANCQFCNEVIAADPKKGRNIICLKCGNINTDILKLCENCGTPVSMKLKYNEQECKEREITYAVPLRVKIRLNIHEEGVRKEKRFKESKEQEVYFGDIPLMTDKGTFIINGTERVIVSQLHRSPGVFFKLEEKNQYSAQIIPYYGSWVEFEHDSKGILYVRIDRKKKILATTFLRALGLSRNEDIITYFYDTYWVKFDQKNIYIELNEALMGFKVSADVKDANGKIIMEADQKITESRYLKLKKAAVQFVAIYPEEIKGYLATDIVDEKSGNIIYEAATPFKDIDLNVAAKYKLKEFKIVFPELSELGNFLINTIRKVKKDISRNQEEAYKEIYKKLRPGDTPTPEASKALFEDMFFNPRKYDFSKVGRLKFNTRLGVDTNLEAKTLSLSDFAEVLRYLLALKNMNYVKIIDPGDTDLKKGKYEKKDKVYKLNDELKKENRKLIEFEVLSADDIDHLGNRRVRTVGELLSTHFRLGLLRMERAIKERMSMIQEGEEIIPNELINAKPLIAELREFFGTSQLSQFMDNTNPLAEITHKRRLSALGPGGLSRERAGFEVRDVHPTHYGRICPVETPEGPNIGLISSLSCYARINEYGFIETPYKKVRNGKVIDHVQIKSPEKEFIIKEYLSRKLEGGILKEKIINKDTNEIILGAGRIVEASDIINLDFKYIRDLKVKKEGVADEIIEEAANFIIEKEDFEEIVKEKKIAAVAEEYAWYLTAWEEDKYTIAQANVAVDHKGNILTDIVAAREKGEFKMVRKENVDYIDISPKQLVSVAASLIPFLENDDANRALMGSNMQRQAVPLLFPEAPIVATGMEEVVARDSRACIVCRRDGIVENVDNQRIVVKFKDMETGEVGIDIYELTKFQRSNQGTCINQRPIVKVGQAVKKGDILADGPCSDKGELALGRNVLAAFMPWRGYNFEDAIVISEKLIKEDAYTSIHIEEFETSARETKLGPEEITRDIPNIKEEDAANLDESGIVRIGAYVKPGDILVGKVTPRGEPVLTPEEKLLRAIFGEKAAEYKDASLKCPPGIEGVVVDVKLFARKGVEKDAKMKEIELQEKAKIERNFSDEIRLMRENVKLVLSRKLEGGILQESIVNEETGEIILESGKVLTAADILDLDFKYIRDLKIKKDGASAYHLIREALHSYDKQIAVLRTLYKEKLSRFEKGDELQAGIYKTVKVYIAMKRKFQVGDKMAGRHGNKGVVAKILPEEEMPFLPDGTPVELILNPLGVPSRMNVGQIWETYLGWIGKVLGVRFISPVFDGPSEEEIKNWLRKANLPEDGKIILRDGQTGLPFEQKVTVGYIYMMKLIHLVDDKIHARSIGPYSLITQQPLGGKAQFGGQRFGEMEVWALEAYGASNILQEILTVKSDDVEGRTKIFENIVRGYLHFEPSIPESFNVLLKELQSLALDTELIMNKNI